MGKWRTLVYSLINGYHHSQSHLVNRNIIECNMPVYVIKYPFIIIGNVLNYLLEYVEICIILNSPSY